MGVGYLGQKNQDINLVVYEGLITETIFLVIDDDLCIQGRCKGFHLLIQGIYNAPHKLSPYNVLGQDSVALHHMYLTVILVYHCMTILVYFYYMLLLVKFIIVQFHVLLLCQKVTLSVFLLFHTISVISFSSKIKPTHTCMHINNCYKILVTQILAYQFLNCLIKGHIGILGKVSH